MKSSDQSIISATNIKRKGILMMFQIIKRKKKTMEHFKLNAPAILRNHTDFNNNKLNVIICCCFFFPLDFTADLQIKNEYPMQHKNYINMNKLMLLLILLTMCIAHHGGYHNKPCYSKSSRCTARKYAGNGRWKSHRVSSKENKCANKKQQIAGAFVLNFNIVKKISLDNVKIYKMCFQMIFNEIQMFSEISNVF